MQPRSQTPFHHGVGAWGVPVGLGGGAGCSVYGGGVCGNLHAKVPIIVCATIIAGYGTNHGLRTSRILE